MTLQKNRISDRIRASIRIPPLLLLGAILILLVIFLIVTLQDIRRQEQADIDLLREKGIALIRSFEAGTRFGMRGGSRGNRWLQQLLDETAQQPEIAYLLLTDADGRILVHSDSRRIGMTHQPSLDFKTVSQSTRVGQRCITQPDGQEIFEVFSRFAPERRDGPIRPGTHMSMHLRGMGLMSDAPGDSDPPAIFIGFDISDLQKVRQGRWLKAALTGLGFFLAGSTGMVLLFLFQNYHTTRASLSRIQAFSDHLVENMPIGLLTIDEQGRITSLNRTAETILDVRLPVVMKKPAAETLPPELVDLLRALTPTELFLEREIDCRRPDGRIVSLEAGLSRLQSEAGNPGGVMLLLKDISEIHVLRKEIARSQRLASLGRMAAGVAHEIRNPLSSIKGFATYFRERYRDVAKDVRIAEIMIAETERLNRSIGQLLELARPVNLLRQRTDLSLLFQEAVRLVESQTEERQIEVHTAVAEEVREVVIDRDRISQMLLNLNLNAIEAMPDGGRLSLRADQVVENGNLKLEVEDSGCGISEENLTKIFDPYFTTRPSGSGLGLAVVHNIVEAHQGQITVQSRPGQGSRFTIIIPRWEDKETHGEDHQHSGGG